MPQKPRQSDDFEAEDSVVKVGLLGASFETGNLGVSALSESTIKCVLHRWPDAHIVLIAGSREVGEHTLRIGGRDVVVRKLPIRISRNIFLANHYLVFLFYALLKKVVPGRLFSRLVNRRNTYMQDLLETDLIADISGGDSFSDIYGFRRLRFVVIFKWLMILWGKPLILLPQTYGPFSGRCAKFIARHTVRRAQVVFSRDEAGIDYLRGVFSNRQFERKVRFVPDVAYVLDSREPKHLFIEPSPNLREPDSVAVGLNVSGLLYKGGYTQDNMFGLKADYRTLVLDVAKTILRRDHTVLLLVPHMFPSPVYAVESDPDACRAVYEQLKQDYHDRVFLLTGQYDQGEIKHIIGLCDFFIGSRMHSCIAAISQCIPTVGLAYSKKFSGVFGSVGLSDCVADIREMDEQETLRTLESVFARREELHQHLQEVMPNIKASVLAVFESWSETR